MTPSWEFPQHLSEFKILGRNDPHQPFIHAPDYPDSDSSGGERLTRGGKVRDCLSVGLCQLAPRQGRAGWSLPRRLRASEAGAEVWCSHGNVGEQRPECQRCGIVTGVKRGFCSNMLLTSSLRRHTGLHGLDWLDAQFLGHLPFHLVIPRFISQFWWLRPLFFCTSQLVCGS